MIPDSFTNDGFAIIPKAISTSAIETLIHEANRLGQEAGSACVRNICSKSEVFRALAFPEILPSGYHPVRSILFDKTADENWPVAWHQDLTIAVREKKEALQYGPWSIKDHIPHVQAPLALLEGMITLRLHLDNTPAENGALHVITGSHRLGKIPSAEVTRHTHQEASICECQPGDILLMSPLILHSSKRSKKPSRRRVLHFEFAPVNALHPSLNWHEDPA